MSNYANNYSHIVEYLKAFEHTLDDNHEVWITFPDYNSSFLLSATLTGGDMFIAFELLSMDGESCSVIQNYSQLNFAVFSKRRNNLDRPKQKIGFKSKSGNHHQDS